MTHAPKTAEDATEEALARAIMAMGSPSFVPRALDYLRTAAPFLGCFLTLLDGKRPPVHLYDNVRDAYRAHVVDGYLDGLYLLDPFFVAYRREPRSAVLSLRDVAPDRLQQSTYFRSYYQSTRLSDEVGVFIDLPSGKHLFYSIGRRSGEKKFSAKDLRAMRRVYPVFAALNRRHFGQDRYAQDEREIDTAMERFGAGVLTEREREIAILILKGHSTRSISNVIGVAEGTVKIHRKNFYRKLEISSQSELFSTFLASLSGSGQR
ncbi:MAG: LuxR C-terminal-related transcriptional regulator [Roseovarius sp.]